MKRMIFGAFFALLMNAIIFAEKTPLKGLYSYELDNGLKLFVAENHAVPLTYIEVAVKCGSYTQTEQTSGVFHLYEHMMFKGNSLYRDAASVNKALSDIGVANWNGTTGLECVNYYFTVPSEMTEKGLEFWNAAVRNPLLDKKEFENEKKVVISEINGNANDPGRIFMEAKNALLFGDAPYTMSPAGTEETVSRATVKQLKEIQKKYYVPNNSALFVGGDVNPDEVFEMVKNIFGSWKKGKDPFASGIVRHNKEPFSAPVLRVMPYDKLSSELAEILVEFRGPDCAFDREDTYAIDVMCCLMENPDGYFKQSLTQDPLIGIPDSEYVWGGYKTSRTCGVLSFGAMVVQPRMDMAERAEYFAETVVQTLQKACQSADAEDIAQICNRLDDDNILARQTAGGLLSALRFWWTVADEGYYFTYNENMAKVGNPDMLSFVNKYLVNKNPLITVLVNPQVYEKSKDDFKKFNFEEIKK